MDACLSATSVAIASNVFNNVVALRWLLSREFETVALSLSA